MYWTKKLPMTEGYYWMRGYFSFSPKEGLLRSPAEVVRVYRSEMGVLMWSSHFVTDDKIISDKSLSNQIEMEWAGPLELPTEKYTHKCFTCKGSKQIVDTSHPGAGELLIPCPECK